MFSKSFAPLWSWIGAFLSVLLFWSLQAWWFPIRFFISICFIGVYVLVAGWRLDLLNDISDEKDDKPTKTQENVAKPDVDETELPKKRRQVVGPRVEASEAERRPDSSEVKVDPASESESEMSAASETEPEKSSWSEDPVGPASGKHHEAKKDLKQYDAELAAEYKKQGNEEYGKGRYHLAIACYTDAIEACPPAEKDQLAVYYNNRAACYSVLKNTDEVIKDSGLAIDNNSGYIKAYVRRSAAYELKKQWHDALQDLNKLIELEPSEGYKQATRKRMLEKKAADQFEKDKEEMVGKLKDLGNMVLGKFGLSTDNFKMTQDPATGGYSMQFSQ